MQTTFDDDEVWRLASAALATACGLYAPASSLNWKKFFLESLWPARSKWRGSEAAESIGFRIRVAVRVRPPAGVLVIMKLTTLGLLCCHWFGCLWWLISDLEQSEADLRSPWYAGYNNWQVPVWLKNEDSLTSKYFHAFFWGAGMVTSMVPRDIEPVTPIESLVTTFTMFFGLLLNATVISSLTTALSSMNSKRELAGKQLDTIKNYLLVKSVPTDLRSRILEYYEYLFTSSQVPATPSSPPSLFTPVAAHTAGLGTPRSHSAPHTSPFSHPSPRSHLSPHRRSPLSPRRSPWQARYASKRCRSHSPPSSCSR